MKSERKLGVILSYVSTLISILIGFLYVPIILKFLTKEDYGLYQLMGALVAYVAIMDFGLGATVTRYYSRAIALKDEVAKQNILAISAIIYAILTLIALVTGFLLYFTIDIIYSTSLSNLQLVEAKQIFIILIINIAITIPAQTFSSALVSHEKFLFTRCLYIFQSIMQPATIILTVIYFPNALSIVIVQTILNILFTLIKVYYCLVKVTLKIKLHHFDKKLVKEMLLFSSLIFINLIVDQIYWKTDQLILGAVVGTASVAIYSISSQFEMYFMNFSQNVCGVFLPQISKMMAITSDMADVNKIFNKIGRVQFAILSLILTGFIIFGYNFIIIWVGQSYTPAYWMALVVMVPLFIPLIQNMGITILQAKNMHWFRSAMYATIAVLNIILSIILAKPYGGLGCAAATGLSLFLGNVVAINFYYHRKVGIDIIAFFKTISQMLYPALISMALGFAMVCFAPPTYLLRLVIEVCIYSVIFFILMWFIGFNEYEKDLSRSILRKLNIGTR